MERSPGERVFESGERLRVVWRIAIYLGLFFLFFLTGQMATSLLPPSPLDWVGLAVTLAAAVGAGCIVLSRFDGRSPGALGFPLHRSAVRESVLGTVVGAGLLAAAVLLLIASGTAYFVPDAGTVVAYATTLLWTLAFFWLAAAVEEALFRGYAFQALAEAIGVWPTVVLSSALFSWAHAQNPNVTGVAFVNIFLAGVLLAVAYVRTRSLWFATAVHLGWNWMMAAVFDFPVSGLDAFDTPFYTAAEAGADWWTGGPFGPEAGLAGTLVLAAGTVWLIRTRRISESPAMRELRPLVDKANSELRDADNG